MGIYEFLENAARGWSKVKVDGTHVEVMGDKYLKPKDEHGWRSVVSKLMVKLRPELVYLADPVRSQQELECGPDMSKDPAVDLYLLIDSMVDSGLYKGGAILRDEGKLKAFYSSFYQKLFSDQPYLAPIVENFGIEDAKRAVEYVDKHFAKYSESHEALKKDFQEQWRKDAGQSGAQVFDAFVSRNGYFSTFKKFGAFCDGFYARLEEAFRNKTLPIEEKTALLTDIVGLELVGHKFWLDTRESEYITFLKNNPQRLRSAGVDPQLLSQPLDNANLYGVPLFPAREYTSYICEVLEAMCFFGFMGKRRSETPIGDTNYSFAMFVFPESGVKEISPQTIKEDPVLIGPISKCLDQVAPPDLFPGFNQAINALLGQWK